MKISLINKYRREIMGFAIVWVMLLHCYTEIAQLANLNILRFIFSQGNIGVEIFLFLSGIGLYYSCSKDEAIIPFYSRRIKRVVIPWLIMAAPYWFLKTIIVDHEGIGSYFLNLTGISFWINGITTTWYVALIVLLYFLYPYIYKIQKNNSKWVVLTIVLFIIVNVVMLFLCSDYYRKVEIAFTRVPIFLLGSLIGEVLKNKKMDSKAKVSFASYIVLFFGLYVIGILSSEFKLKIFSEDIERLMVRFGGQSIAIIVVLGICILLEKFGLSIIKKGLSFLGGITLELYLIHVFLDNILSRTGVCENKGLLIRFLAETTVVVSSVLIACLFSKLYNGIVDKLEKKNVQTAE